MAKRLNGRRVKIHRNYTIAEAAAVLGVHKHPVSRWIAAVLPTTDDKRPFLIHGNDIRAFLKAREPGEQTCRPGEFYCLRCRAPRRPAADMADYIPKTSARGMLIGICPSCETLIHRAANLATIEQKAGGLTITFQPARRRIEYGQ
jgi:hypothetical protein